MTPQPSAATPTGHARALLAILVGSTLIRLAAAAGVPILDDEAHYWVWSRHLMWGYPDHPPMIAALVAASTRVLGDSVLAVRLPVVLLATVSTLAIYALARRLFSPPAGLRAAILFQVLPAVVAGGIIAAPDGPLAAYWLLAMLFTWMATRGASWAWPAAGVAAGLAIQCKLAGGALPLSLAGFILASQSGRRWLRTPGPYLAVLAGALVLAPLVWWNVDHGWATVKRALTVDPWIAPTTALGNIGALIGSQFVYYAPLGFAILVAALVGIVAHSRTDERFRFLLWCAAPTVVAVALASVRALAKPHYTGPAILAAIVAAAGLWPQWRAQRLLRVALVSSWAITLAALFMAAVPTPLSMNFHQDAAGWPKVAREAERLLPTLGQPGQVFVLAETYQAGSQLAFATQDRVSIVVPFRGFDLWEPPAAWVNRNGLLMDHLERGAVYRSLSLTFERLEAPHTVPVTPGYDIFLYPGINFRGLDATP